MSRSNSDAVLQGGPFKGILVEELEKNKGLAPKPIARLKFAKLWDCMMLQVINRILEFKIKRVGWMALIEEKYKNTIIALLKFDYWYSCWL